MKNISKGQMQAQYGGQECNEKHEKPVWKSQATGCATGTKMQGAERRQPATVGGQKDIVCNGNSAHTLLSICQQSE